jgi:hypothetical protein
MPRFAPAALVAALCLAPLALAQSADETAVKDAAAKFLTAMSKGDRDASLASFDGDGAEKGLIEAFVRLPVSVKNLRTAVTAKFGEAGANELKINDMDPAAQIASIRTAPVNFQGDTAVINVPNNPGGMTFKKSGGEWKVSSLTGDAELSGLMTELVTGIGGVMDTSAADLNAGKFATLAETKQAMETKARGVMEPLMPRLMAVAMKKQQQLAPATQTTR